MLHQSIGILLSLGADVIKQPTSPLKVLLEYGEVDPNFLSHPPHTRSPDSSSYRALHFLSELTVPDVDRLDCQVLIARQLFEHGADVNALTNAGCGNISPLHKACMSPTCTNLDLIKLYLDHGANPNLQSYGGKTPLHFTLGMAPSAARLLLTYPYEESLAPTIDVNVPAEGGSRFLSGVVDTIKDMSKDLSRITMGLPSRKDARWTHPAHYEYYLRQMEEVKALAIDMGGQGISEHWETHNAACRSVDNDMSRVSNSSRGPALPYDVGSILGMELLGGMCGHPAGEKGGAPDWYRLHPFFVPDQDSEQLEVLKKESYLYSGQTPEVGMRVEIKVVIATGYDDNEWLWGRLCGKVTEVGELPSDDYLEQSDSQWYGQPCLCGDRNCCATKTGARDEIVEKYGAVHGQEAKCVVSLSESSINHHPLMSFFHGTKKKYTVTLRMNDHKENMVSTNLRCVAYLFFIFQHFNIVANMSFVAAHPPYSTYTVGDVPHL
mmetsp:Transcript_13319/g.27293  ORF Transcript_13319/g.27293 Transcript_13319/m.27293 type:complete len:493 (+) Transcript_13319:196-1674(+)